MGSTTVTPSNPFDAPLASEMQDHQAAQTATQQASPNGNPFDEPLASEKAEQQADTSGRVTNDVGNTVIVPKDGESFSDTMKRAAAQGHQTTPDQINKETSTMPGKAATVLAAAPAIGAGGAAALAAPGAAFDTIGPRIASLLGAGGAAAKEAEQKLVNTVGDAAEKLGLERPDVDSFHESVANLASQLKQRAQGAYQQLDEQIPGFQELKDKIQQYQQAYKLQSRLDPEKAETIKNTLDNAKQTMSSMLEKGQSEVWESADKDWQQYKSLQQVLSKTAKSAEDLTSDELTNLDKLKSGLQSAQNATKGGSPVDYLKRAFPEHSDQINLIVQEASDKLNAAASRSETAKHIRDWLGLGGSALVGAYEGAKALTPTSGK